MRAAPIAVVAFALYTAIGIVRYDIGRSGNYDLGIFAQGAQRWSQGRLPGSAIRGLGTLFADHFSPITVLFGAAWAVWSDPRALIVTQALALAAAVFVLGVASFRRLPPVPATVLVVFAALAKGAVSAAVFDVHETGLAAPVMAGLCYGLLERRRTLTMTCALALLLGKEDLGLTVAVAGLIWWRLAGDRRTGLLLIAAGLVGAALAFAVVLWANPEHTSPYLQFLTGASGNAQGLPGTGVTGGHRWEPALLFAATAGIVGLRSPIAALALPTLTWRVLSSNPAYWQTYFHYDVLLVPIAAFALLDILSRPGVAGTRAVVVRSVGLTAMAIAAGLGVVKAAAWPLLDPSGYRPSARLQAAAALGRLVPPGEAVAAQQELGPVLIARLDVRMLSTLPAGPVRWVILTPAGSSLGAPEAAKRAWLQQQQTRPGVETSSQDGVLLLHLPAPAVVRLT